MGGPLSVGPCVVKGVVICLRGPVSLSLSLVSALVPTSLSQEVVLIEMGGSIPDLCAVFSSDNRDLADCRVLVCSLWIAPFLLLSSAVHVLSRLDLDLL